MEEIILQTGSNLGDRKGNLAKACYLLEAEVGSLVKASKLYLTEAWGVKKQPAFYNQILWMRTALSPQELLAKILELEIRMGRIRRRKWGERTIDIDIIFYGDQVIQQEGLTIPHPWLQERNFVLMPLAEIAPHWVHPILRKDVATLLQETPDQSLAKPLEK